MKSLKSSVYWMGGGDEFGVLFGNEFGVFVVDRYCHVYSFGNWFGWLVFEMFGDVTFG